MDKKYYVMEERTPSHMDSFFSVYERGVLGNSFVKTFLSKTDAINYAKSLADFKEINTLVFDTERPELGEQS